jgi:8-oxo-dGTP pyrophosphatase MutT (NUDIX family)
VARDVLFEPGGKISGDLYLGVAAGLIDDGAVPASTAARELLEETSFRAVTIHSSGVHASDPGRLSGRMHCFLVGTAAQIVGFQAESGVSLRLVTPTELLTFVLDGTLSALTQLETLLQAVVRAKFRSGHWPE